MAFTPFTSEEYMNRFGQELSTVLPNDDDQSKAVERAIADVTEEIKEYIHENTISIDFESLSTAQQDYVNKACMEQLKWRLDNADFGRISGYNAFTNSMMSKSDIDKRKIAPNAKKILMNHIICTTF